MAAAVQALDEIIKEYLLFRGFASTLKAFEGELKLDKDKSFRVSILQEKNICLFCVFEFRCIRLLIISIVIV